MPKGFAPNWIPTAGQGFFVYLRLYDVYRSIFPAEWKLDDIEQVK
jgi:hypothetical protein